MTFAVFGWQEGGGGGWRDGQELIWIKILINNSQSVQIPSLLQFPTMNSATQTRVTQTKLFIERKKKIPQCRTEFSAPYGGVPDKNVVQRWAKHTTFR